MESWGRLRKGLWDFRRSFGRPGILLGFGRLWPELFILPSFHEFCQEMLLISMSTWTLFHCSLNPKPFSFLVLSLSTFNIMCMYFFLWWERCWRLAGGQLCYLRVHECLQERLRLLIVFGLVGALPTYTRKNVTFDTNALWCPLRVETFAPHDAIWDDVLGFRGSA